MSKHLSRVAAATEWFYSHHQPADLDFRMSPPELVTLRPKLFTLVANTAGEESLTNAMPIFVSATKADRAALLKLAIEQDGAVIIPGNRG